MAVDPAALDHIRNHYVNPSHPVFDLIPDPVSVMLDDIYAMLGRPAITRTSIWDVYLDLLHQIQDAPSSSGSESRLVPPLQLPLAGDDVLPLLENQADLPFREDTDGYYYMGGVGSGLGMRMCYLSVLLGANIPYMQLIMIFKDSTRWMPRMKQPFQ